MAAWPVRYQDRGPEEELEDMYDRVVFIGRYLRQSVKWVWRLDLEEIMRYERALNRLVKIENGVKPDEPGRSVHSPFGFSDYEGGG